MLFKSHDFLIAYRYTFNACLLYAWHESTLCGWYDCIHLADEKQSETIVNSNGNNNNLQNSYLALGVFADSGYLLLIAYL